MTWYLDPASGRRLHLLCGSLIALSLLGSSLLAAATPDTSAIPFPVGEKITYQIYWGFIPVGESIITSHWVEEDGRKLLAIRFRTRTNKVLGTLYPVDDLIESVIDPATFLPVRFTKNLKEGGYRAHEVTTFDRVDLMARWHSFTSDKTKEYPIEADTRDIVSFMYYTRGMDFEPGEKMEFRVMADEEIYDVFVNPEKYEKVKVIGGDRIRSLKMEPEAAFDGLFIRKGRIWMWLSEEEPRVLTQVKAEVPVASVRLVLDDVSYIDPEMDINSSEKRGQDPQEEKESLE